MRLPFLLALAALMVPLASAAPEQLFMGLRDPVYARGLAVQWVDADPNGPTTLTLVGPDGEAEVASRIVPGQTPGIVREARLPELRPGAAYQYRLGGKTVDLAPVPGENFTFAALGDMATTRAAGDTVETLAAARPSFVLHAGDISYAQGNPEVWKRWFTLVEPVASATPWLPALGNHEGDVLGVATDEAAVVDPAEQQFVKQRFPLPRDTFWYSFDVGGVHFVALDTFSQLRMPAEEVAWLEQDLAAARDARWIVAYLHEPPYSSNDAHGSSPRAHDAFAAALEAGGVDVVIAAHDHSYERTHPLRGGEVVGTGNETRKGNGTVYFVSGGAGANLYESFLEPQPGWSAVREAVHHVLLVDVTPASLTVRAVATGDGRVVDELRILADAPGEAPLVETPAPAAGLVLAAVALAAAFASRRR